MRSGIPTIIPIPVKQIATEKSIRMPLPICCPDVEGGLPVEIVTGELMYFSSTFFVLLRLSTPSIASRKLREAIDNLLQSQKT